MRKFFFSIGAVAAAYLQWMLLVVISWTMGTEKTSEYLLVLAFYTPVSVLTSFCLRNIISADVDGLRANKVYAQANVLGVLILALFTLGVLVLKPEWAWVLPYVFTMKLVEHMSEYAYGFYTRDHRADKVASSRIARAICATAGCTLCYVAWGVTENMLVFAVGANFIAFVVFDLVQDLRKARSEAFRSLDAGAVLELLSYALPLILATFVITLYQSIPRLFLGYQSDASQLVRYAYLIYYNSIVVMLLAAIFSAYIPSYAKKGFGLSLRHTFSNDLVFISLLYMIFIFAFSESVTNAVYSVQLGYSVLENGMAVLAFIFQLYLSFVNYFYVARGGHKVLLYSNGVSVALLFVLCSVLIPRFGMSGALSALAGAYFVQAILLTIQVRKIVL